MDGALNRGEIWLAQVGGKKRPVLILTRSPVIDVRRLVTVAEITSTLRGLAAEVEIDPELSGVDRRSAVNCDGIHTIARSSLTSRVGGIDDATMKRVCWAIGYALDCG